MKSQFVIKLSLFLNYFVFAILLNSVGTVILQVQNNFGITEGAASVLEGFKDLSIAITSFLIASFIARIGYRKSMLIALLIITVACLAMPSLPKFWMTKVLFAATGIAFALTKVSVFATIGLVTKGEKAHLSFMNFLESFFMVGILLGYFIFSAFVDDSNPQSTSWLKVYYPLAALTFAAFILLLFARLDESEVKHDDNTNFAEDFFDMLKLIIKPLVLVFIISVFLYVLIEQSIMSWLPTFNSKILNLPTSLSIQMASILAGSTALGRFLAGFILKKYKWINVLSLSLILASLLVLITLPLASGVGDREVTSWFNAPVAAYAFPVIGLCIAPIYPAINSAILTALPQSQHASMSGLIVVFSALGGTTGSVITGNIFEHFGGQTAFYFSLVPIAILFFLLIIFWRATHKHGNNVEI